MIADLLLVNGRIITFAGKACEALAVIGDRVAATGGSGEILALRGGRTKVVDLRGRLALPGFTESHVHLAALAQLRREVNLSAAASMEEALRLVAACARRMPAGKWITGGRFDKNRWGHVFPTRHDLDGVAPDHPVALSSRDGHSLWVNSRALRKCGITAKTKSPPGGEMVRDKRGQPTGMLLEGATALVRRSPAFSRSEAGEDGLRWALRHLLRRGITSVHAMDDLTVFSQLQELREAGRLHQRVAMYLPFPALGDLAAAGIRGGFGDEWLRIAGIKLFADGALGSQTAWLFEPYCNSPRTHRGIAAMPVKELRACVRRAAECGFPCTIHAIGDRANAEALGAIEAARECGTSLPHRIEHAQLVRPEDCTRFRELGVVASMQPCHILGDIAPAERYWGKRSRYAYPVRSLLRAGTTLAFGSDAPVETADPIKGVYAAVARQALDGRPVGGWYRREEGVSVMEALRCYCVGPAVATGEARLKGRLSLGCLADVVVLTRDIRRLSRRALLGTKVDLTVVGGRVRFRRRGERR